MRLIHRVALLAAVGLLSAPVVPIGSGALGERAPAGTIVFASKRTGSGDLYAVNAAGGPLRRLTEETAEEADPAWAPDGRRIVFDVIGPLTHRVPRSVDVTIIRRDGSGAVRIARASTAGQPSWSPDGQQIVFATFDGEGGRSSIHIAAADGSNDTSITGGLGVALDPAWAPRGDLIAFQTMRPSTDGSRIAFVRSNGAGLRLLAHGNGWRDTSPAWSPDGRRVAFGAGRGSSDGYLFTADRAARNVVNLTSRLGFKGYDPAWSPDGRFLAFACRRGNHLRICIGDLGSGRVRQLTFGATQGSDRQPTWHR
jgi:Tol biopolymer transport system component